MIIAWWFIATLAFGQCEDLQVLNTTSSNDQVNHVVYTYADGAVNISQSKKGPQGTIYSYADDEPRVILAKNKTAHKYLDIKYIPEDINSTNESIYSTESDINNESNSTESKELENDRLNSPGSNFVVNSNSTESQDPNEIVNSTESTINSTIDKSVQKQENNVAGSNLKDNGYEMTLVPHILKVLDGEMSEFNCSFRSRSNRVLLRWFRNGHDMLFDGDYFDDSDFNYQTGQSLTDKYGGLTTYWNVLRIYEVTDKDSGVYTCYEDYSTFNEDVYLWIETEDEIKKKTCVSNLDCWISNFQCINFRCIKFKRRVTNKDDSEVTIGSSSENDSTYAYGAGLRFLITAFVCGGLVVLILLIFSACRVYLKRNPTSFTWKILQKCSPSNSTTNRRNRSGPVVYFIGNTVTPLETPDKPPNYDEILQCKKPPKDETPPPSYRHHKTRVFPPPPYEIILSTSATPLAAEGETAESTNNKPVSEDEKTAEK